MGFRINTNVGAMTAHRNATLNNVQLDNSLTKLSSGLRINKAADDSAGLAIADKLKAQANGLGQATNNANDAIGLIQTADGALQEYTNIVQRIRTLAVQSANDTQDSASRSYIQTEVNRLISSASFINTQTKFNGKTLFTNSSFTFHVGAYSGETTKTTIDSMTASNVIGTAGVSTQSAAEATISAMDSALGTIDTLRASLGAAQNQLESVIRNVTTAQVNVTAAESQIRDVDFAAESANFNKRNILAQSGSYAMSQSNAVQQNVLRLLQ
ncbi:MULTISPECIES: flagellin [Sulfurimonas]|uniref:Flagellin n=1 Tax=Sulfurimonas marina TaxID=2590551 RepID=A0A7M3V990_9BACT|nr:MULTISPECIES: flagellin [Sulfurimonas]QOP40323.1 flagellin [Sulfurimonas marina]